MHCLQIGFHLDPQARQPRRLLEDWYSLAHIADAVAAAGTRVSVVQACSHESQLRHGNADYFFMPPGSAAPLADTPQFRALLAQLRPDVFHVHGLAFAGDVLALRAAAPQVPILLQDHASRVPRWWRRAAMKRGLAVADGVSFCAAQQAEPFREAGLLPPGVPVFEIPESSSTFSDGDRRQAREDTGIFGDPCVLWVGHLDSNKDPLTVLEGAALAAQRLSGLRLWCVHAHAPLLRTVEKRIASDPLLRERVGLLGRVSHARIESLMRAADIFVLGSHREGSGYSLIEALSCGVSPAVSDIPSFRALTGNGAVGSLWRTGDAQDCARALIALAALPTTAARAAVRAHFEAQISFNAIGQRFAAAYAAITRRRAHAA